MALKNGLKRGRKCTCWDQGSDKEMEFYVGRVQMGRCGLWAMGVVQEEEGAGDQDRGQNCCHIGHDHLNCNSVAFADAYSPLSAFF